MKSHFVCYGTFSKDKKNFSCSSQPEKSFESNHPSIKHPIISQSFVTALLLASLSFLRLTAKGWEQKLVNRGITKEAKLE